MLASQRHHFDIPREVAYLDVTGSGVETIAHLRENGRIVLMFCAFAGPPKIVRLHGQGEAILPDAPAMRCEVGWALTAEGALTADDVDRRLRFDLVPAWSAAARPYVDEVLDRCPS